MQSKSSLGHQGYPVPWYASQCVSLPVSDRSPKRVLVICRLCSTKLLPLSALILPPFPDPPLLLTDRPSPCHFCLCYLGAQDMMVG